ncbi:MAG: hypothetical protein H7246_19225 [Phycisphaerae bacterium]|nr:hypothetical protein [Saprospiraceae bacterium]
MKNASFFFATTILVLFGFQTSLSAQRTATWKGGTPGRSTDWNCPTNWKEGRVPDEFSSVVIPDVSTSTFSYPVIHKGTVEIFSLECSSNVSLTTQGNARVIILNAPAWQPVDQNAGLAYSKGSVDSKTIARN